MSHETLRRRWLEDPEVRAAYEGQLPLHRLGARVAARRSELRLSQVALARKARVTQRQISALENGKANVTLLTLLRVASSIGLELDLLGGAPEQATLPLLTLVRSSATTSGHRDSADSGSLGDVAWNDVPARSSGAEIAGNQAVRVG